MSKFTEKLKNDLISGLVKLNRSVTFVDDEPSKFTVKDNIIIDVKQIKEDRATLEIRIGEHLIIGTLEVNSGDSVTVQGLLISTTCNLEDV